MPLFDNAPLKEVENKTPFPKDPVPIVCKSAGITTCFNSGQLANALCPISNTVSGNFNVLRLVQP